MNKSSLSCWILNKSDDDDGTEKKHREETKSRNEIPHERVTEREREREREREMVSTRAASKKSEDTTASPGSPQSGRAETVKGKGKGKSEEDVVGFFSPLTKESARADVLLAVFMTAHALIPTTILPPPVSVVLYATLVVVSGCLRSLKPRDDDGGQRVPHEVITQKEAMQYPLIGSAVLLSLFLALKFVPKEFINALLTAYFCLLGALAVAACIGPVLGLARKKLVPNRELSVTIPKLPLVLPEGERLSFSVEDLACLVLALPVVAWYVLGGRYWLANNVLGVAFSVQAVQHVSIGSFKIGSILLVGLFFYDIFWVFGTPVMVSVAKGIDAPIKLLFPRGPGEPMSLLGLGDIVIPGIFIALLYRLDDSMCSSDARRAASYKAGLYFTAAMVGYVAGISTTIAVMVFFKAAQPALLYIVPFVILMPLVAAAVHGEVKQLLAFTEEEDEDEEEETATAAKKDGGVGVTKTPSKKATKKDT